MVPSSTLVQKSSKAFKISIRPVFNDVLIAAVPTF